MVKKTTPLRQFIRRACFDAGVDMKELARYLDLTEHGLRSRLLNPERLRAVDMVRIVDYLGVTYDALAEVITLSLT